MHVTRIAAMHIIFTRISCTLFTCDMYMCRLRHINDPVLSSLKMKGIRLFFWTLRNHVVVSVTSGCCCDYVIFSKQHGSTLAENEARSRNQADRQYDEVGSYNAIQGDGEFIAHLLELQHNLEWQLQ
jgi:hypothetical protein